MHSNMSFTLGNFKGTGKANGYPVFLHQLPATRGGTMGVIADAAPAKFGRLVSANPSTPDVFVMGTPAGTFPVGVLIFDPVIAQYDPGMNDTYFEGRPATVLTFGPFQLVDYADGLTDGALGTEVWANKITGEIGFAAINAGISTDDFVKLNATVFEKKDPNGTTVWLNQPVVAFTASESDLTCATPVATPGAGAVASGTTVALKSATAGATIYYTTDGSAPDNTDTEYTTPIAITAGVTIKAIAYKDGYVKSAVLTAVYTVA